MERRAKVTVICITELNRCGMIFCLEVLRSCSECGSCLEIPWSCIVRVFPGIIMNNDRGLKGEFLSRKSKILRFRVLKFSPATEKREWLC